MTKRAMAIFGAFKAAQDASLQAGTNALKPKPNPAMVNNYKPQGFGSWLGKNLTPNNIARGVGSAIVNPIAGAAAHMGGNSLMGQYGGGLKDPGKLDALRAAQPKPITTPAKPMAPAAPGGGTVAGARPMGLPAVLPNKTSLPDSVATMAAGPGKFVAPKPTAAGTAASVKAQPQGVATAPTQPQGVAAAKPIAARGSYSGITVGDKAWTPGASTVSPEVAAGPKNPRMTGATAGRSDGRTNSLSFDQARQVATSPQPAVGGTPQQRFGASMLANTGTRSVAPPRPDSMAQQNSAFAAKTQANSATLRGGAASRPLAAPVNTPIASAANTPLTKPANMKLGQANDVADEEYARRRNRIRRIVGTIMGMGYGGFVGTLLGKEVFGQPVVPSALTGAAIGGLGGLSVGTAMGHINRYTGDDRPPRHEQHIQIILPPDAQVMQRVQGALNSKQGSAVARTLAQFVKQADRTESVGRARNWLMRLLGKEMPQVAGAVNGVADKAKALVPTLSPSAGAISGERSVSTLAPNV